MKRRILVVAAHPDDEILGCGGTIARLVKEGHRVSTLILGEGVTSRDASRDADNRRLDIGKLRQEAVSANRIIGVREVSFCDFPDNRFDTVPFLDIVKTIENMKKRIGPAAIFTHYHGDLNVDHRITYGAVITAARPMRKETVREIYSFEALSSTEWNYPSTFSPDIFFDITGTIGLKLKAMGIYKSELRKFPHPRSLKGVRLSAECWGIKTGLGCAEAFKAARMII